MGQYGAVDTRTFNTRLRWRETRPSRLYRRYDVRSRSELMFRCRDMLASLPDPD